MPVFDLCAHQVLGIYICVLFVSHLLATQRATESIPFDKLIADHQNDRVSLWNIDNSFYQKSTPIKAFMVGYNSYVLYGDLVSMSKHASTYTQTYTDSTHQPTRRNHFVIDSKMIDGKNRIEKKWNKQTNTLNGAQWMRKDGGFLDDGIAYVVQNAGDVLWWVNEKWVVHWTHATTITHTLHASWHTYTNEMDGFPGVTNNNNTHKPALWVESAKNGLLRNSFGVCTVLLWFFFRVPFSFGFLLFS